MENIEPVVQNLIEAKQRLVLTELSLEIAQLGKESLEKSEILSIIDNKINSYYLD